MTAAPPRPSYRRLSVWVPAGYVTALVLLILGPLLSPGYLLQRDAVSTPRSYLTDAALGLTEAAPRAVPQDFAVAVASAVVNGGVVVITLLGVGLWLAGYGAARLAAAALPARGVAEQLAAATVALWNPYVAERLLQGHWSLLVGYGCLPWTAVGMLRLRTAPHGRWVTVSGLAFWLALAGLTPTGLLLAVVVALVVALAASHTTGAGWTRWRCAATVVGIAVAAGLPWLTATAVSADGEPTDALAAFAARAEPRLGTLGSLMTLGGIWNSEAVPASRSGAFIIASAVGLAILGAFGLPVVWRSRPAVPLLWLAAAVITVVAAGSTGPGQTVLGAAVQAVPGLAVLRDGQKWMALAVPGYTLIGAGAVSALRRWLRPSAAGLVCAVAVLAPLPDLAWGVAGTLRPARYPAGWSAVARMINADPRTVAVLPADGFRRFTWTGGAGQTPVLDPLPRWLRADVLATGDLTVSGRVIPGEGTHARSVQRLLLDGATPAAISAAGVGWLVIESDSAGEFGRVRRTLKGLSPIYADDSLRLYSLAGDSPSASPARRAMALGTHLAWLLLGLSGAIGALAGLWRGELPVRKRHR